jgi:hypothetical protein
MTSERGPKLAEILGPHSSPERSRHDRDPCREGGGKSTARVRKHGGQGQAARSISRSPTAETISTRAAIKASPDHLLTAIRERIRVTGRWPFLGKALSAVSSLFDARINTMVRMISESERPQCRARTASTSASFQETPSLKELAWKSAPHSRCQSKPAHPDV